MSHETFNILCHYSRPHIEPQVTRLKMPTRVEQCVAVTAWKLVINIEYRTLAALFGLGCSTVCTTVVETCSAIVEHLFPRYVYFSMGERLRNIVSMFETG